MTWDRRRQQLGPGIPAPCDGARPVRAERQHGWTRRALRRRARARSSSVPVPPSPLWLDRCPSAVPRRGLWCLGPTSTCSVDAAPDAMAPASGCSGVLVIIGETRPLIASKTLRPGRGHPVDGVHLRDPLHLGPGPGDRPARRGLAAGRPRSSTRSGGRSVFNVAPVQRVSIGAAWLALAGLGAGRRARSRHTSLTAATSAPMVAGLGRLLRRQQRPRLLRGRAAQPGRRSGRSSTRTSATRSSPTSRSSSFSPLVALVADPRARCGCRSCVPPMFAIYATTGMALDREHQANHDA